MQSPTTPEATPTRVGPGSLLLCLALALLGSAAVVLPRSLAVEVALPAKACVALLDGVQELASGASVDFVFDAADCLLFDAAGKRVQHAAEGA